jgi:hypothetical protein
MVDKADEATFEDAFNMLCGDWIGAGIHRTVYDCALKPGWVVKVENQSSRYFANVMECKFWNDHESYKPVADWLAPCGNMSPDGRLLLQKRIDPLPLDYALPDRMPKFLCDFKPSNYGLLNGRIVCIDYAMVIPTPSVRLKKMVWR